MLTAGAPVTAEPAEDDHSVPQVVAPLRLSGRVHADEAQHARAHTKGQLKFTVPGPMTIIDTISDSYYGDRVKMAFAFAELLNEEVRALQADCCERQIARDEHDAHRHTSENDEGPRDRPHSRVHQPRPGQEA